MPILTRLFLLLQHRQKFQPVKKTLSYLIHCLLITDRGKHLSQYRGAQNVHVLNYRMILKYPEAKERYRNLQLLLITSF